MNNSILNSEQIFDIKDWQRGYQSQKSEFQYWINDIEGEIPLELTGTLFRNGPGLLDINEQPIHHPFDGDGMICAISFNNGRAHFRNRFVETTAYLAEKKAGKILYRGVFGTQKPDGLLANIFDTRLKNIANTNVIYWGNKLLALWEAAAPHRLNPYTLDTIGIDYLDGILNKDDAFAAHPRIDSHCLMDNGAATLVNFSVKTGLTSIITIYEFNLAGEVVRKHSHSIPGFAFLHDMAITPNYCIFFQNPVSFNPLPYLLGYKSAAQCLKFASTQSTKVILIPRNGKGDVKIIETKPCFVFHHANAFEQGNEIIIDSVCYDSFLPMQPDVDFKNVDFALLPVGNLWRFQINLDTKSVKHQVLDNRCCEFPSLHPNYVGHPHRYLYIGAAHAPTGNAPLQAILKLDLHTGDRQLWSLAPKGFVGEPIFVPFPNSVNEDDGWLLILVYDATYHRSDLVILDAHNLDKKPIARLHLKHHIPYGLHGSFTPQYFVNG